jgi:hypothetical protein
MHDVHESLTSDFDTRLAVLEERTKPKPKTVFERIKDWSGILTFVIAVLYTYPLGVWDRFVVTAKEQKTKEIADLRSIILQLTQADAENVRAVISTSDAQAQTMLGQIANARRGALLAPNLALIEKHYSELTGGELELIGYQLNLVGDQGPLVVKILESATQKMIVAKNNLAAADAYRIEAQLYGPYGSLGPNVQQARTILQKAVVLTLTAEPARSLPNAIAVAMDWANLEAVAGDWACTEKLANWLISQFQYSNPGYAQTLQSQFAQLATYRKSAPWIPSSQGTEACSDNIFPWNATGWPWTKVTQSK